MVVFNIDIMAKEILHVSAMKQYMLVGKQSCEWCNLRERESSDVPEIKRSRDRDIEREIERE